MRDGAGGGGWQQGRGAPVEEGEGGGRASPCGCGCRRGCRRCGPAGGESEHRVVLLLLGWVVVRCSGLVCLLLLTCAVRCGVFEAVDEMDLTGLIFTQLLKETIEIRVSSQNNKAKTNSARGLNQTRRGPCVFLEVEAILSSNSPTRQHGFRPTTRHTALGGRGAAEMLCTVRSIQSTWVGCWIDCGIRRSVGCAVWSGFD